MNRAPGPNDRWWMQHENTCNGTFTKIKEPDGYGKKKGKENKKEMKSNGQRDIRTLFGSSKTGAVAPPGKQKTLSKPGTAFVPPNNATIQTKKDITGRNRGTSRSTNVVQPPPSSGSEKTGIQGSGSGGGRAGNIFGFGGTSFGSPTTTSSAAATGGRLKTGGKSGTFTVKPGWNVTDNSTSGQPVNTSQEIKAVISANDDRGRALGGAGGSSESHLLSPRAAVRNRWAQVDSSRNRNTTASTSKNTATAAPATAASPRPSVIESTSSHNSDKDSTKNQAARNSSSSSSNHENDTASCPVCHLNVPVHDINVHLDGCLEQKKQHPEDDSECVFSDSDDEMFMKMVNDIENETGGAGRDIIDISDDDEPLVKKKCNKDQDESLDQDDRDLLAAFNDEDDHKGEFACPVCQKLVSNLQMNSHLNLCLSS